MISSPRRSDWEYPAKNKQARNWNTEAGDEVPVAGPVIISDNFHGFSSGRLTQDGAQHERWHHHDG